MGGMITRRLPALKVNAEQGRCFVCGGPATTRDHIPPRGIFPEPLPDNLITVPACPRCNSESCRDDEYFRLVVPATTNDNPRALALLNQRILKRARRKPGLVIEFLKSVSKVDEVSSGGIYLGPARAVKLDRRRIQTVINKIVRGLFFHHTGRILGGNCVVEEFWYQPRLTETVLERICALPLFNVGDGSVFSYRYELPTSAFDESAWFLMFYNEVLIISTTGPLSQAL